MKKSIIAALVLVACLLLAPFGFGKLAEKRVNAGLDELVEQVPYLVIKERTWQGGWFKSSQEVKFELSPAFAALINPAAMQAAIQESMAAASAEAAAEAGEAAAAATEGADAAAPAAEEGAPAEAEPPAAQVAATAPGFTIRNDVVHGPVLGASGFGLARVDTTFVLPEEIAAEVRKFFGPEPALQVRSRVGFFSGGSTTVSSEGRTIKPEGQDFEITYDTFKMVMGYGGNFDTYDFDGALPRLEVKGGEGANAGNVLLTSLTMKGDGKRVQGELYDGDAAFGLAELKFTNEESGKAYSVANLHYNYNMGTRDGFTDITAQMGSGAVDVAELAAIGLKLDEVHYDFSFRHLHADTLDKLMLAMRDSYGKMSAGGDPTAMMAAMQSALFDPLKEHGAELLKHDPVFGLDRVGLVTPEGEGVIKGTIGLKGATIDDFTPAGAMGLIGKVEADITIQVPQKLVDKIPNGGMVVGMAVGQGYAVLEGDNLVCHIEFKGGSLKINGKEQQLPPGILPGAGPPMPTPMPAEGA